MLLSKVCAFSALICSCIGHNWYSYEGTLKGDEGTVAKGMWEACVTIELKYGMKSESCYSLEPEDVTDWLHIVRAGMVLSLITGAFAIIASLVDLCDDMHDDDRECCQTFTTVCRFSKGVCSTVGCAVFIPNIPEGTDYGRSMWFGIGGMVVSLLVVVVTIFDPFRQTWRARARGYHDI